MLFMFFSLFQVSMAEVNPPEAEATLNSRALQQAKMITKQVQNEGIPSRAYQIGFRVAKNSKKTPKKSIGLIGEKKKQISRK